MLECMVAISPELQVNSLRLDKIWLKLNKVDWKLTKLIDIKAYLIVGGKIQKFKTYVNNFGQSLLPYLSTIYFEIKVKDQY